MARVLPNGWVDLLRQIVLFCGAYWLYRLVRGLVDGRGPEAFENARAVIAVERDLGLFFEPAVHAWASGHALVIDVASWMYVNSHFAVTTVALAWLYLRRNERFYFVRNMFMVAMGIALVGYMALPTAPPRFMPEWGFTDSVAAFTGVEADSASADLLFNPYAAIPSMHVAFALMLGVAMAKIVRRRWARALWLAYAPVGDVRGRGDRQPLVAGRVPGRGGGGGRGGLRPGPVRPRPARGVGVGRAAALRA